MVTRYVSSQWERRRGGTTTCKENEISHDRGNVPKPQGFNGNKDGRELALEKTRELDMPIVPQENKSMRAGAYQRWQEAQKGD
mmetsp:Transcript_15519/g.22485  ORF Transcript_15519/g.22485 Transcript_15519/m.22485 type:complete len:83 (+) Transcript_15519:107-355(+)